MNARGLPCGAAWNCSGEPWLRYRDTGLCVIPSRHGSVEFAWLVHQSGVEEFDKVLVELPSSYPVGWVVDAVGRMDDAAGAILIPKRGPFRARVPEFPGDPEPEERVVFVSTLVPVVADSMMMALRMAARCGTAGPKVEFIDVESPGHVLEDDPDMAFPFCDPQEVAARGLQAWYARWEPTLRRMPRLPRDVLREAAMAERLRAGVLREGCKALFVCGAAHWPRISDLLDGPPAAIPAPLTAEARRPDDLRLVAIPPVILFSWHQMDIPFVVGEFEEAVRGKSEGFDRDSSIRRLLCRANETAGRSVPPGSFDFLQRYLNRRVLAAGRWSCDLDEHLLDAARVTAGSPFAHVLEQEAMNHNPSLPDGVPLGRVVPAGPGGYFILAGGEAHHVMIGSGAAEPNQGGRPFRVPRDLELTPHERKQLKTSASLYMKPSCEERLHKNMCDTARHRGHELVPEQRRYQPRVFRGHLAAGIEPRRTLRARALGQGTTYVRHRIRVARNIHHCDECPVVWIFHADRPVLHRVGDFFPDGADGDQLFTSFFWFCARTRVEVVHRNRIAFFVRIHRNVTPSWDEAVVDRLLLSRIPPGKKCRVRPWNDESLSPFFSGPDLAVACAVKWALADHVIIVRADPSYAVGPAAAGYARASGVRLLTLTTEAFDPILLARYELDHELPTKGAWHRPDERCLRFVEPVPGFDAQEEGAVS
ncbi:MAG: hypothetical protein V1873_05510 [Verrucomicrobiota bacterium]